jgi:hypothetical protein
MLHAARWQPSDAGPNSRTHFTRSVSAGRLPSIHTAQLTWNRAIWPRVNLRAYPSGLTRHALPRPHNERHAGLTRLCQVSRRLQLEPGWRRARRPRGTCIQRLQNVELAALMTCPGALCRVNASLDGSSQPFNAQSLVPSRRNKGY